jgi:hypothetical protein
VAANVIGDGDARMYAADLAERLLSARHRHLCRSAHLVASRAALLDCATSARTPSPPTAAYRWPNAVAILAEHLYADRSLRLERRDAVLQQVAFVQVGLAYFGSATPDTDISRLLPGNR